MSQIYIHGIDISDYKTPIPTYFPEFTSENSIAIYAGPLGTLYKDDPLPWAKFIETLYVPDKFLLFDNCFEGHVQTYLDKIYSILQFLPDIPVDKIFYFTSAINADIYHNDFCVKRNITKKIHINVVNLFEYHTYMLSHLCKDLLHENTYVPKNRDKIFLCFNRMLRLHRLGLATLVSSKGLLQSSYYSLFKASYGNDEVFKEYKNELLNDCSPEQIELLDFEISKLENMLPLKLNIEQENNVAFIQQDDLGLFDNSYLSVVTETYCKPYIFGDIEDMGNVFFTEKTYKPILAKHPFMIAGIQNILEELKKLGYKTFSPFICEDYDKEPNYFKRLELIVNELERLSTQTLEDWMLWQQNVKTIVDYNYNLFVSRKFPEHYVIGRY